MTDTTQQGEQNTTAVTEDTEDLDKQAFQTDIDPSDMVSQQNQQHARSRVGFLARRRKSRSRSRSRSMSRPRLSHRFSSDALRQRQRYTPSWSEMTKKHLWFGIQLSVALFFLGILYTSLETVRSDIQRKMSENSQVIMDEIQLCQEQYVDNHCHPDTRVPFMESRCSELEKCISRDPKNFGRARIAAEAFSEIIEAFMKPLSLRTVLTFTISAFGILAVFNLAYGLLWRNQGNGRDRPTVQFASDNEYGPPRSPVQDLRLHNLRVAEVEHEIVKEQGDPYDPKLDDERGRRRRQGHRRHGSHSRSRSRVTVRYVLDTNTDN